MSSESDSRHIKIQVGNVVLEGDFDKFKTSSCANVTIGNDFSYTGELDNGYFEGKGFINIKTPGGRDYEILCINFKNGLLNGPGFVNCSGKMEGADFDVKYFGIK